MSEIVAKTRRRKIVADSETEEKPVKSTRGRKPKKILEENAQEENFFPVSENSSENSYEQEREPQFFENSSYDFAPDTTDTTDTAERAELSDSPLRRPYKRKFIHLKVF